MHGISTVTMATPSSASPQHPKAGFCRFLVGLAWLLLTIHFLAPPREVFDQTLDRSNYATYTHFVTQGLQWGVDVLPMAGPLGFVLYLSLIHI